MQIPLEIKILSIEPKILRVIDKPGSDLKAVCEVLIHTDSDKDEPLLIIRGYTIREKEFEIGKKTLVVSPPAYPTRYGMQKSFIVSNLNLYKDIQSSLLREYEKLKPDFEFSEEELDQIDEDIKIPF